MTPRHQDTEKMQCLPLGYFRKTTAVPPNWSANDAVIEICSVSHCLVKVPDGWIEHWLHNQFGLFNTQSDADAVLPPDSTGFSLFAYRLLPLRYIQGRAEPFDIPPLPLEPLRQSFVSLGFDVVSQSVTPFFECSPLSCNGLAQEVPVNRDCLIDHIPEAVALAERFSVEEPEPGTYYVIEVLREPVSTEAGDGSHSGSNTDP